EQSSTPVIQEENKIPFDTFWNLYEKKVGRPRSESLWKRIKTKDQEKILEYIPAYKKSKPEKKFRKDPERFLRDKVWEDEIIVNETPPQEQGMTYKTVDEIMAEKGLVDKKIGTNHFDRSQLLKSKSITH
ncbi:MAG: hypothetical protein RLY61_743, partial [Candidatus Parcubacteria bacterium]